MFRNIFSDLNVESHNDSSLSKEPNHFLLNQTRVVRKESSADLHPANVSLESFTRSGYLEISTQQLYILKEAKLITSLRVILSMIAHEDEDLDWLEIFALFEVILRIEEELTGQSSFLRKYGKTLQVIIHILSELDWKPTKPERTLKVIRLGLSALPDSFFIPKRNLRTEKLKYRKSFLLIRVKPSGTKIKFLPPKAFIGKGYGDKGTAKNVAKDASPSWQEVAMAQLPKEDQDEIS